MRRSLIEPSSAIAIFAKSSASAIGSPWKLPPEITRPPPVARADASAAPPSGKISGLSVAAFISMASTPPRYPSASTDRAVDLRHAAQRVRVLDLVRGRVVRPLERAVAKEPAELARDGDLARMGSSGLECRRERHVRAEQRLDRHRRRDAGGRGEPRGVHRHQRTQRRHQLRAVEDREPLLGPEDERLQPGLSERDARRHDLPAHLHLPAPDERQRQVRERREVTGGADGPLGRHDGVDAEAQEVEQALCHDRPGAREAERQRVRAEQEHRAHDLARQRLAHAGGVADEQVLLEPLDIGPVDRSVGERPEPGRQPVDDRALVDERIDDRP